jgi:diguanylate cyclase (GGDEF)-like protein
MKMSNRQKDKNSAIQLKDIVELDDHMLTLSEIESIAGSDEVRKQYEKKYKGRFYKFVLLSLTHESFKENEAKVLWDEIVAHMRQLNEILGRNVGLSVASLDYLTNIQNALSEPKIIEEDKSSFIADATTRDELTGLYLREVFDVVLKKEFEQARRRYSALCLLLIDIDDFKKVNDTHGHQKGDEILQKIGATLNDTIREMDLAARYGGEELAIIMPGADIAQGYRAAERIRRRIETLPVKGVAVTVSIGVGQIDRQIDMPAKLIRAADMALYQAKHKGKNRVSAAGDGA